jgi:diguanylate cyclase (GGDEF)-like protein
MDRLIGWGSLARLSLTTKLTAINVLLALALMAVVAVAWRMFPAEANAASDVLLLNKAQRSIQNADMLHDALNSDVLSALLVGQVPSITADAVLRSLSQNVDEFRREMNALNEMPLGAEIRNEMLQTRIAGLRYIAMADELTRRAVADRNSALAEMAAFLTAFDEAKSALARQIEHLAQASEQAHSRSSTAAQQAQRWLALAAAVTVVLGWIGVALVARSIRLSLTALSDVAGEIAAGQLDRRSAVRGRDEVAQLAEAINRMADKLREMIQRSRSDADQGSFGTALVEALDMADSEPQAHTVVARAMVEVSDTHAMELLVADSSNAQLERAAEHPMVGAPGCSVESAFSCIAVRRGHAVQFADSQALNACPKLRGRPQGRVSAACVPLTFMGRALGVLHAVGPAGQALSPLQIQRLGTLGAQAGSRIGTVRAFERTQLQASTDGLTGLANRRSVEARMRELALAGRTFALVMCDLDHFKRLNDTYGHPAGDDALRTFSFVVRACAREKDVVARWGGEEFAFVLENATGEQALAWTERVREQLAQTLRSRNKPLFTASFGIADNGAAPTQELLVRLADDALYSAKAEGRDRAVLAESMQANSTVAARPQTEQRASVDLHMLAAHE